jgi:plastocyanin
VGRLRTWRVASLVIGAGALLVAGCNGDDSAATVLVDYDHDEFATQFIRFFPEEVQVHPGARITFRQHWTGEPHTVTLGTIVDEVLEVTRPLLAEYGDRPYEEVPGEVLETYFAAESQLPCWYCGPEASEDGEDGEDGEGPASGEEAAPPLPQALAQPCIERSGSLPASTIEPCADQEMTPFDGTEAYYNSGIIPYEGPGGNTFVLELADDIEPGTYGFYCAVHGSF